MTGGESLDDIAAALYSLPPGEFIAARNERAADAGGELASGIRSLRKPTVAAWIVNLFASERATQLGQALALAAELRDAQADLDAKALAQLGRERRALTNRLAAEAVELARARGARVTDAALEAVRQTISAAFFDPDAASAVASGRLVHELEPSSGESALDMSAVVGGSAPMTVEAPPRPSDELAARRERRRAEKAVHDAEQSRARADRDHGRAQRERDAARRREAELASRIADLEAQLARAHQELTSVRDDAASAERRVAATAHELASADAALARARRELG